MSTYTFKKQYYIVQIMRVHIADLVFQNYLI